MVCGTPVCNRASGDAGTLAVVRSHKPGGSVAPPVLVRGATMFLKRAGRAALACVSVGLAYGCSYDETAQAKGEDDVSDYDSAECTEGEESAKCDAGEPRGASLSLLSRRATGTRAAWRNGHDRSARRSSALLRSDAP